MKQRDIETIQIPKNASWVVRKILTSRDQLQNRQQGPGVIQAMLKQAQHEGKFSIHKMYLLLLPAHPRVEWRHLILHPKIYPTHKFTLWLAMHRRLATVERLERFGIDVPLDCVFCGQSLESFTHLFFECHTTRRLWSRICAWLGHQRQIQDWNTKVTWACKLAKSKNGKAEITSCAFAMVVNMIWKARNFSRFQKIPFQADQMIKEMVLHLHTRGRNSGKWRDTTHYRLSLDFLNCFTVSFCNRSCKFPRLHICIVASGS